MSRQRYVSTLAKACLASLLLAFASGISACDEDGKTAPERCADPPLPIFDIQAAGAPDNAPYPCSTPIGHAVNFVGSVATAGAGAGGMSDGEGGRMATAGAGAGGAP